MQNISSRSCCSEILPSRINPEILQDEPEQGSHYSQWSSLVSTAGKAEAPSSTAALCALSPGAQPWAAHHECSPWGCAKCLKVQVKPTWGTVSTGDSSALFSKQHHLEEVSFISLGNHVFRHGDFFEGRQILWAFILNLLGLFLDMGHYWNKIFLDVWKHSSSWMICNVLV